MVLFQTHADHIDMLLSANLETLYPIDLLTAWNIPLLRGNTRRKASHTGHMNVAHALAVKATNDTHTLENITETTS